uniref:Glyco_hydro_38C domain-containing protein n=1 Tax=Parastrongyloides trichosuri TaxID=131310 RepID=A0A0N4ZZ98_PARTI
MYYVVRDIGEITEEKGQKIETGNLTLYKYDNAYGHECSINVCAIGLYFRHTGVNTETFKALTGINEAFYLTIDPTKMKKYFVFEGVHTVKDEELFPLVQCPYKNWISSSFLTRFEPDDHIINNGILVSGNNFRSIFLPAFQLSSRDEHKNIFPCGKLLQGIGLNELKLDPIQVGFKIKDSMNIKPTKTINFDQENLKYDGNILTPRFTFIYIGKEHNTKSQENKMFHFGKTQKKLYYGAIILSYEQPSITDEETSFTSTHHNLKVIKPTYVGKLENIKMKFTLKVKTSILKVENIVNSNNENIDVIFLDKGYLNPENKTQLTVKCQGYFDGTGSSMFDEYFDYAFKTKLNKLKNNMKSTDIPKDSKGLDFFDMSLISGELYGRYFCQLDTQNGNEIIPSREVILLPKIKEKASIVINVYSADDKYNMFCESIKDNFATLKKVVAILKDNKKIEYDVITNKPEGFFDVNKTHIILKKDKFEMENKINIMCDYDAFNYPYMEYTKVMSFEPPKGPPTNDIMIPIILGIGGSVLLLIVIVVLISLRIVKRRRKIKLLSQASSAVGASSMSESKFSKSSVGGSRSTMSKSKSKSTRSASKSGSGTKGGSKVALTAYTSQSRAGKSKSSKSKMSKKKIL